MEATMETEEVMEEKNPNALVLIDEGKQFAVKTDCMDPEALFLDKKHFVPMLNQVKKACEGNARNAPEGGHGAHQGNRG